MPIVLSPSVPNPGTPTTATSADGKLTVTVDFEFAGVLLRADWSSLTPDPTKIRFFRDGLPVRSGDPAWSPGGIAYAYDHEAPLGVSSSWTAAPVLADGSLGAASTSASVTVPFDISDYRSVWLKSIDDPALSLKLLPVFPLPAFTRQAQASFVSLQQSPYPIGTVGRRQARTAEYHFYTDGETERDAFEALVDNDGDTGVYLLQHAAVHHTRDIYCILGDTVETPQDSGMQDADREWILTLTEVQRPPTVDSPFYFPGHSNLDARAAAPLVGDRKTVWPTLADALVVEQYVIPSLLPESGGADDEGSP